MTINSSVGSLARRVFHPLRVASPAIRLTVTVSILGYLALKIQWRELMAQLIAVEPMWLVIACLWLGLATLLAAFRWWFLLRVQGISVPPRVTTELTFIGQFFNTFMLGSIGGDLIKAMYVMEYAPRQRTHAALSILVDRGLGLLMLLCGTVVALPSQIHILARQPKALEVVRGLGWLSALAIAGIVILFVMPLHLMPATIRQRWTRFRWHRQAALFVGGLRQHGRSLGYTLSAVACAIALTLVLVIAGASIARALHLSVTFAQMLVTLTVAICVISLPISIGGHGVREAIFVLMFAALGVTTVDAGSGYVKEPAVLFSLLFFALSAIWGVVGAWVYLTYRRRAVRDDRSRNPASTTPS